MLGNNIQPKSFFKYKKQLKFLPTNLIDTNLMPNQRNDDMLLKEAYDNVISYLENNPIYIPLFLYTLYSFSHRYQNICIYLK